MTGVIVGIDGGGTHTTLAAAAPDGRLLGCVEGGALNFHSIGMSAFRKNLSALLHKTEESFGPIGLVGIGHSALDGEPTEEMTTDMLAGVFPADHVYMESDVWVTLMGATMGKPGVAVVAGTGSMAVAASTDGRQIVRGGWGWLLGDPGSGFELGQKGLTAAALAFDGVGPRTILEEAFLRKFEVKEPRMAIEPMYSDGFGIQGAASFAPEVLKAWETGDAVAENIVNGAVRTLTGYASGLIEEIEIPDTKVAVFGGLFEHSEAFRSAFTSALHEKYPETQVEVPVIPPCVGAIIYALNRTGKLNRRTTDTLNASLDALNNKV